MYMNYAKTIFKLKLEVNQDTFLFLQIFLVWALASVLLRYLQLGYHTQKV